MAVVTTNLGVVTAYGDAVEGGYTGTKEQWQALMADYGTIGTQAQADAQTASTAAQTATTKASEASASATQAVNAKTAAETAQEAAEDAAESVSASAAQIAQNTTDIAELKEDFKEFSGYTNYALTEGKYYATNGQTVNIDAPSSNNGWKSCVIECTAGDNFYITGQSGSSPRLWCFVDASNSRTSAVVRSVAISGKTGDNLLITAPENTTHLVCNFIATQPAKLTRGQTLPEAVNALEGEISNAVSVANGVFVTNVPELACILDANIYVTGYDKVAINYFWYNSPQHTAYETYINLKGYKNGAWESIIGAFSRATAPDNRPNIERVVVDGVFDLVINWSLISNPFTSTYNDTNRPVFKNTCLAIDYSETPQIAPFEEQDTIKNIVVVDASGNGDYTTLTDAYASIKDSDLNNQYEIVVTEGTYQEQYLIPPPYTHTHGMKAETTIITSVGLPYYDPISDWASVFQMMNTCKLSNLTVISGTKYCIHEDDYSLSGKMVKCENVIFHQTKVHNNAVVGNGTQFYGTKYIFNNCTFINGSFTNHSNTRLQKGANQHTVLNGCRFIDAVVTLSAVPASEDGQKGLYLFDINGCTFSPTVNTLVLKFGQPITGSAKLNYPWVVGGYGNDGIDITFDNANDTRFTDAWDSVNLSNKTFVKATEAITKGDHVTANGAITTTSDYYGTALSNGNTGDYVPIWKQ